MSINCNKIFKIYAICQKHKKLHNVKLYNVDLSFKALHAYVM